MLSWCGKAGPRVLKNLGGHPFSDSFIKGEGIREGVIGMLFLTATGYLVRWLVTRFTFKIVEYYTKEFHNVWCPKCKTWMVHEPYWDDPRAMR